MSARHCTVNGIGGLLAAALLLAVGTAGADFTTGYNAAARQQWDLAAREFRPLAEQGDVRAQVYLATMYRRGLGLPRSLAKAAEWYGRAAEQGDAGAQYNLAVHYREGLGVATDQVRASELFEQAARQGMVEAQINLGLRLFEGLGFEQPQPVLGFAWLHKAAQSGNSLAMRRRDHFASDLDPQQRADAEALAKTL